MQWKRLSLSMIALITSQCALANTLQPQQSAGAPVTKDAALNAAVQMSHSYWNNYIFNATNRPEWLTRTFFSYAIEHQNTPVSEVETTQPLYMDCWNTLFWQGRMAYNSNDGTGNLGLGYRYLTDSKKQMFGVNAFLDKTMHYNHRRVGLGGEYFTQYITVRANYYDAISSTRYSGTSSGIIGYQRALSGYDASIEAPVPFVSWARIVAQGYRWRGNQTAGVNGGEVNLRLFPARQVEIDVGASDDNANGIQTFLKVDYYLGAADFIENSASTSSYRGMWAPVDLERQRLQKVIRHNDIVLEKTNNGISGSGIIVARGT